MRRLKVILRAEATKDLDEIYRYIVRVSGSPETAIRFIRRMKQRCKRIGNVPYGGRPRDDLESGLRTVPFESSAVVAYKVEADCVRITNIFYGGRDYEAFYLGEKRQDEEDES